MIRTVSALVPVYNEVDTLPVVLNHLYELSEIHEVIVVDDGSTDALAIFNQSPPRQGKIHLHETNQGKTAPSTPRCLPPVIT